MEHKLRLRCKNAKTVAPTITFSSMNKGSQAKQPFWECIINDSGELKYLDYLPNAENENERAAKRTKIHKQTLTIFESVGLNKFFYMDFVYYDSNEEAESKGVSKKKNEQMRLMVDFLRRHREVSVKDLQGKNVNPNTNNTIFQYELLDFTNSEHDKAEKSLRTIDATSEIAAWYRNDKPKLLSFAYTWGIKDIPKMNDIQLYNRCVSEVSADLKRFYTVKQWMDDKVIMAVRKGMLIKKDNGTDFIIYKIGSQYMYNGQPVGAEEVEIANHFKTNTQDYLLLKNELKIVDNEPQIELPLAPAPEKEADTIGQPRSAAAREKSEKQDGFAKLNITQKLERIIIKGQDIYAPKVSNRYIPYEAGRMQELVDQLRNEADFADYMDFFDKEEERFKQLKTKSM